MRTWKYLVITLLFALTAGCSTLDLLSRPDENSTFIDGQKQISKGNYEVGLVLLEQAAHEEPENKKIRLVLMRQREAIVDQLLSDAGNKRLSGDLDLAEQQYNRILDWRHRINVRKMV